MTEELVHWLMSTGHKWDMWRSPDGMVCVMLFADGDILNEQGYTVEYALAGLRTKYERLRRAA